MIKKNDLLIYETYLEKGDEFALMLAIEDEHTPAKVPMVSFINLNTNLSVPPINCHEAKYFKIVGHTSPGDTPAQLVQKYLPKDKWIFTDDLFIQNFISKTL